MVVESRAETSEEWLPLWRALVLNQHLSPDLRQRIRQVRQAILARIEIMYRPELDALAHKRVLIALETITDFESWSRMRDVDRLSVEEACAVWIRAIDTLLPATPVSGRSVS